MFKMSIAGRRACVETLAKVCSKWSHICCSALLRATARSAKRVLDIVILSVRLSVTTRYRFKPRWDRDSWFSPQDSL